VPDSGGGGGRCDCFFYFLQKFICCVPSGARQRLLPSARKKTLGKDGFAVIFFHVRFAECGTR